MSLDWLAYSARSGLWFDEHGSREGSAPGTLQTILDVVGIANFGLVVVHVVWLHSQPLMFVAALIQIATFLVLVAAYRPIERTRAWELYRWVDKALTTQACAAGVYLALAFCPL